MARPSPFAANPSSPVQPFERLVRDFLSYCKIECGFAPATLSAYSADLRELSLFLISHHISSWRGLSFDLITQHMRELDKRGLVVSSIARHVATIRVFCRFAESSGLLPTDPAKLLTQPSTWRHLPGVLSPSQMEALLKAPQLEDVYYLRDKALLEL
ncbi:MAG: site-specific integrase, partial [Phycisphaeraceae bacterium]